MWIAGVTLAGIIIMVVLWYHYKQHADYLYGCWTADSGSFCETAEIDTMMLFIGEQSADGSRTAYLIITPDMCNQGLTMRLSGGLNSLRDEYEWRAVVEFDESPIWPENVTIRVSRQTGTLTVIGSDDVVYASLVKQHDITNAARIASGDE